MAFWHRGPVKMRPTLETLPPAVRSQIWDAVGEEEDLGSLLMTSRTTRDDILSGIPGAPLSCGCPRTRPCRCGRGFEIDRLTIIVDSVCSERRWLKFSVRRTRHATPSVWCVADLDSPLARALRYCRPRETVVEFQSPKKQSGVLYGAAYMVLRAKLFDVCEILGWFRPQRDRLLQIRFADPWPPGELPFWEFKLTPGPPSKLADDLWHEHSMQLDIDPDLGPFEKRPLIYESLLMPLILNSAWRNAEIVFETDPNKRSTFAYSMKRRGVFVKSERFDYSLLSLTAWAYMDQLIHDGAVKLGDDDLTPYFRQYDNNARAWAGEKTHRRTLQAAFHSCLLAMIDCSCFFDLLLEQASRKPSASPLLDPLRSHIRRTRNLSSANSFSKDRPDTEAADWPWNLDPIRHDFVLWALEDAGKRCLPVWQSSWLCEPAGSFRERQDLAEDLAITHFLRWRKAHTPLWPKSWTRNWPPLEKKEFVQDPKIRALLGFT